MSLFPPKQRPGESDLEWALRVCRWNHQQIAALNLLERLIVLTLVAVIAIAVWKIAT